MAEKFYLATGRSRKEIHWKNKEWGWDDLVKRLSKTHYTAETHEEYMAANKSRQDEIKDVGGFVGGYLTGGKRNKGSVLSRQIITLDADNHPKNLWDDFCMLYDAAAVCYSTHKHTPENPRLRLIILLSREVTPDEYEAISRKVAGVLGIELFDPSTFQAWRLMYWPSTSKGAEYFYEYQEGAALDADKVLSGYKNWKDSSEWPVSAKHQEIITREIKKQGDPLEKTGMVGAFCRSYNIHEVIEKFLDEVYDPCDKDDNRYTFKAGSTSGGLIVYDDKFAYSHHGTDPSGGQLCNSFDLVRLHLFGLKDEDNSNKGNRLPSYQAMLDFASKDKVVRQLLGEEKIKEAFSDFEGDLEEGESVDTEWTSELETDRKGNAYRTISNAVLILENAPVFKDFFAFDEFERTEVAVKNLPWRKINKYSRRVSAEDEAYIRMHLESPWGISGKEKVNDAFAIVTQKNKIHPVKEYIESHKWDGVKRLDSLFIDFMGAEDSHYTRAVTRKTLVGAISRIYNPGCQLDYMLVFVGPQGTRKSSIIGKLGRDWVNESFNFSQLNHGGKEASEQVQGFWIIEIPEMTGFDRADINAAKAFIARRVDNFRVAYGRKTEKFPRQCIMIGNSNNHEFLTDTTGNRRYWPLTIRVTEPEKSFEELTEKYVGQVWAEALIAYKKGEKPYLDEATEKEAKAIQDNHTQQHPWKEEIEEYLGKLLPEQWDGMTKDERYQYINYPDDLQPKGVKVRDRVCLHEIWVEGLQQRIGKKMNRMDAGIIKDIMNGMEGWERSDNRIRFGAWGRSREGWIRTKNSIEIRQEMKN